MAAVAEQLQNYWASVDAQVKQVIVENGGDIYFNTSHPIQVGIFAGKSLYQER